MHQVKSVSINTNKYAMSMFDIVLQRSNTEQHTKYWPRCKIVLSRKIILQLAKIHLRSLFSSKFELQQYYAIHV